MQHKLLLPHSFKKVGWMLLIPATVLGLILVFANFESMPLQAKVFAVLNDEVLGKMQYLSFSNINITSTLVGMLFIAGALLVGFSKEKNEDEYIASLRQSSLLWAVLINGLLLFLSFALIYGTVFLNVMLYNMFTVLVIYIARFHYILYRNAHATPDEQYH